MPDDEQEKKEPALRPFQSRPLPPPEPGAMASEEHRRLVREGIDQPSMRQLMNEANNETMEQRVAELGYVFASQVEITNVDWLWFPWLAYGKLSVLDGDPSLGKSTMALSLAANVTTGFRFPMEDAPIQAREPANVVLLSAEDSAGDTIAPRLHEAGARLERVAITRDANGKFVHLPEDVNALHRLIVRHHARFVVIDVLAAYMGGRGMNSHADADVRTVLAQLSAMAEDTGASVLALRHLNKTSSEHNAMYRGGGSIAIIGAARTAFIVAKNPRDETRRVLACVKNNLAPMPEPIGYSVTRGNKYDTARIQWHQEPVNVSLAELLRPPVQDKPGPAPTARDVAVDFIVAFLQDGPQLATDIQALAELQDISQATLYRAAKHIGVKYTMEMTDQGKRKWWTLPDHDA